MEVLLFMTTKNYKPQIFAEMLGVSVKTLQRWDREGYLIAHRSPTNRRYYTDEQYRNYQQLGSVLNCDDAVVMKISFVSHTNIPEQINSLYQYANDHGLTLELLQGSVGECLS